MRMCSEMTLLRLAVTAGAVLAGLALPPATANGQRPQLIEADPADGSPVFNTFDMVALKDGTVLYANPKWSGSRKRPIPLGEIRDFVYTPYDRDKGGRGIAVREIFKIQYWEESYSAEAEKWMDKGNFKVANYLVTHLEQGNKNWPSVLRLRARIEAKKAEYKAIGQGLAEEGIKDLERLAVQYPGNSHVETALINILLRQATEALGAEDPDMAGDYLNRAADTFPSNRKLAETRSRWHKEAEQLIVVAERAQKTDSGTAIAKAQRTIRLTDDLPLRRRARIVIRNAEGLLLASYEDPGAFEPVNATRPVERQIVRLMHDFLMERNLTGTEYGKGDLVAEIRPTELGKRYEIDLRRDQRFSDGSPITAADVVASVELLKDPAGEAHDAEWSRFVESARQLSPFSVQIDVNPHPRPDSLFFFPVLSSKMFTVLPRRGTRESRSPTVSGPFRLVGVYPNGNVELVANGQFRSPPQIGKITFRRYVQRGTGHAVNDLLEGRIHTISDPSPAQIQRIRNVPAQFVTKRIEPNSVWVLAINHATTVFGAQRNLNGAVGARDLRRAVALAIDRQGILNQYFNLGGKANLSHAVVSGPFPRQSPAYDRSITPRAANVAAAKSLVNRYSNVVANRKLVLKFADQGDVVETAMVQIKRDLESVGLRVNLQKRPANAFVRELRSGSYDLAYYRVEHDNVLFNIANLFDTSPAAMKSGQNFMRYNNQALTQMFEDLRLAKEGGQIWKIQNGIHRFLHTEAVIVPLWQLDTYFAHTRRLVGRTKEGSSVDLPMDSSHIFRDVDQWYLKPIE